MPELKILPSLDLFPSRQKIWNSVSMLSLRSMELEFPSQPRVSIGVQVRREGVDSQEYLVTLSDPDSTQLLAVFTPDAGGKQWFARDTIYREVLAQAYDYSEPRLGMSRWPTLSETANDLLFNITEGSGENQVSTVPATVELLTAVESVRVKRQAVIVELMDDGQWRVAGYGDGQVDMLTKLDLNVTPTGTCYALSIDDFGLKFTPSLPVEVGQRIRPTRFAGWLYEITEPGQLPSTEPDWWAAEGDNPSRSVGTARAVAVRYFRPLAHGPVTVEMI